MEAIRFVYEEDLHIGLERKLAERGVHVYDVAERMAKRLVGIAANNKATSLMLLGDIKHSILYPGAVERESINRFFEMLSGFKVEVLAGNHDAHLGDILEDSDVNIRDEAIIGECALMHGNRWPSKAAMEKKFVVTAHNHAAVSLKDSRGAVYSSKAWLIAGIGNGAGDYYREFNKSAKLIAMPAFNDFITGTPVNELGRGGSLGPLLRNKVFDYPHAKVYTLRGELLGDVESLKKGTA
jgi:putative SbcD/Mre11-related phosphoesterase